MKKLYLILSLIAGIMVGVIPASKATIHVVDVEDFSFTPSSFIATTGDTIQWVWMDGGHTTTSTTIPAGADTWDAPLTSGSPTFQYVPNVAGVYSYVCTPHVGMGMTATFTVINPTGIAENTAPSLDITKSYIADGMLYLEYASPAEQVTISVFDITGQRLYIEKLQETSSGVHKHTMAVGTLPAGIYILNLMTDFDQRTRRLIVE